MNTDLFNLTSQAYNNARAKVAAINSGGEQVRQTAFGSYGGGMLDPNPQFAVAANLAQQREAANNANYIDSQMYGTNFQPYQGELNEKDQTLAYAINPTTTEMFQPAPSMAPVPPGAMFSQGQGLPKTASDEWKQKLASTGLFSHHIPDPETFAALQEIAKHKTATIAELQIMDMINTGALQQIAPHLIPKLI